jgi:hypothetical protein
MAIKVLTTRIFGAGDRAGIDDRVSLDKNRAESNDDHQPTATTNTYILDFRRWTAQPQSR